MKLYIKYMVSLRCKIVVRDQLENLRIPYECVDLGFVETSTPITGELIDELKKNLSRFGLELMDDKKSILIDRIKNVIIEMVHYEDELPKTNFSDYLSEKLDYDYTYLANIFSEVKGITIQHFIIIHKIEKVKELLLYDNLSLSEVAYRLHYSSVAHLSNQFKKVTGLTPSYFKKLRLKRHKNLENI
jgi:AraC-like DNA-binding protein